MSAVQVSAAVFAGLEAVRRSGLTNMLDLPAVARIAEEMGFEESASWVHAHRDLYARAIFHGFEVTEHPPHDGADNNDKETSDDDDEDDDENPQDPRADRR